MHRFSLTFTFINFSHGQVDAYFEVEIQYIEQLDDKKFADISKLKVRKVDKIRRVYGQVEFKISLDNSNTVEIIAFKKQGGEYRRLPYRIPSGRFCDFYEEGSQGDVMFYQHMANLSTLPYPAPCPYPNVSRNVS